MTAILSLDDNKIAVLLNLSFVDGRLWSMSSANALGCSSSKVTSLICSAFMQSGMSVHDSIVLMVMCMPAISSSLFVFWLCLDSQSVMNSSSPGLNSILMYWFIHNTIL